MVPYCGAVSKRTFCHKLVIGGVMLGPCRVPFTETIFGLLSCVDYSKKQVCSFLPTVMYTYIILMHVHMTYYMSMCAVPVLLQGASAVSKRANRNSFIFQTRCRSMVLWWAQGGATIKNVGRYSLCIGLHTVLKVVLRFCKCRHQGNKTCKVHTHTHELVLVLARIFNTGTEYYHLSLILVLALAPALVLELVLVLVIELAQPLVLVPPTLHALFTDTPDQS